MDLIGLPLQIIVGEKNLANNKVEIKDRRTDNVILIETNQINKFLQENYEL